ncbi:MULTISPECIES: methylisocitrate lyase [unclassified Geomicrobium]|uniref:methylisocitrate lyase n=1 Tax=unclassified Geomicrobium TaxID=2628951 RepID=UPI00045ED06E|nr:MULTISPECIES: methylisocitrate lyase [unclassified Geomicrobium]GAK01692.1 methylisocitrate lyase [Geomicrobium sp. JCM 19055]GAK10020.1 methylisocitrate lyase [Geomicrobium sp. JCM 19038]
MSWVVNEQSSQQQLAERFLKLVKEDSILQIPGAHDGMSALMAKKSGFEALYLSGAAYTASQGLPDVGFIYSNEIADRARELIRATDLPVLVDIDTGYGGVINVARAAKEMLEAGVAAVQIEDQALPKKCGHLNGKQLVSTEDMTAKIKTLKEIAPSLVVVARTDAKAVEGQEAALKRIEAYVEAGADAIFPEALINEEDFQYYGSKINVPLLANMTEFGKTPYYSAVKFEELGFSMVIYPVTSMRVAAKAYERVFREIREKGTQKDHLEEMQTRADLYDTIQYYDYENLDEQIAKTVLPVEGKEQR